MKWSHGWLAIAFILMACGQGEEESVDQSGHEIGKNPKADGVQPGTGLRPATREELADLRRRHIRKVRPNQLAVARANQERGRSGLPALDTFAAVPIGESETEIDDASQVEELSDGSTELMGAASPSDGESSGDLLGASVSSVDNSALSAAPPIGYQGAENSCVAFTATYYAMSHEHCLARGCDNKTSSTNRFSPRWTYNMVNRGSDNGSSLWDAFGLMEKHGAASLAELPYVAGNFRPWDLISSHWRTAIGTRLNSAQTVTGMNADTGMQAAKSLLANGHVLTFGTYISSWLYSTVKSDPNTPSPYAGQKVAYVQAGTSGGHAMAFVGYDDTLWVDINNNGVVDTGERGAFKVANSWGTSWGNAGFMWLAYDALRSTTAVPGGPSTKVAALQNNHAYLQAASATYTPKLLARVTVRHAARSQLSVSFGASSSTATSPTTAWAPAAVNYKGGAYAFDGTTTAVDGTFYFDLTSIASSGMRYHVRMADNSADANSATMSDFRLVDVARGSEVVWGGSLPASANGSSFSAWIDYDITTGDAPVVDSQAPTAPSGVSATLVSATTTTLKVRGKRQTATALSISVAWSAATDNVGVSKYLVFRNGSQVGTVSVGSPLSYSDKSTVTGSGSYTYTVKAQDAAGNLSATSNSSTVAY